ncbi:LamG domain-containing protein [Acinetobacter sp. ANC 5383]
MSSVNLNWDATGQIDSYKVYRSISPMNIESLPTPIATDVMTKSYSDNTVVSGTTYYYRVGSVRNGVEKISEEINIPAQVFNVVSLLHFENNFIDEIGNVWSSINGASISTEKSKFGTSSIKYINSSAQYLRSEYSPNFDLLGSAFTIEFFIYLNSFPSDGPRLFSTSGGLVGFNTTNGIHILFQLTSNGKPNLQLANPDGSASGLTGDTSLSLGTWHHISACWENGIAYVSLDGQVKNSNVSVSRPSNNPIPSIGTLLNESTSNPLYFIDGFMDEFRITKGFARYKSNFTVPTSPLSA